MAQFKISTLERNQTSGGKDKINATLISEDGQTHTGVTLWGDFPSFVSLQVGDFVNGDLNIKQNGKWTNKTLYPAKTYSTFQKPGGTKSSVIKEAQDRKKGSIEKFQDAKEYSIMVASTASQATQILVAQMSFSGIKLEGDEYQEQWLKIRYWLRKNWNSIEPTYIPGTQVEYPTGPDSEDVPF